MTAESIYDYFARKLGAAPSDQTLKELPLRSGCGVDCQDAIDIAAEFIRASDQAVGDKRTAQIREIAEETCRVFWHG